MATRVRSSPPVGIRKLIDPILLLPCWTTTCSSRLIGEMRVLVYFLLSLNRSSICRFNGV